MSLFYLDANASSRIRPEAQEAVSCFLSRCQHTTNASSVHSFGRNARSILNESRKAVGNFLARSSCSISAEEIPFRVGDDLQLIFTSGGTEACNAMIGGFLRQDPGPRRASQIVCSAIEHPAVLKAVERQKNDFGYSVSYVKPAQIGDVSSDVPGICRVSDFVAEVSEETQLVTLMAANNETGALQPVRELALTLRANGYSGAICCDITQALGKSSLSLLHLFQSGVDAVALSGHKLGSPAGVGVLLLRSCRSERCLSFRPAIIGGKQEGGYRSGTENLLSIYALGKVCESLVANVNSDISKRKTCRDYLWEGLRSEFADVETLTPGLLFSDFVPGAALDDTSLCNTLMVRFPGCRADDLVVALDLEGIAVSAGSACSSGKQEASHVVEAIGVSRSQAREYLRISLDWDIEREQIDKVIPVFAQVVRRILATCSQ